MTDLHRTGMEPETFQPAPRVEASDNGDLFAGHSERSDVRLDRQRRCAEWVTRCFGANAMKPHERGMRFFEEAVELAQALGISAEECTRVVAVMFARPAGDPRQELGGSSLGLLGIAAALDANLDDAERGELERIESKSVEHFRARQQAKADLGISAPSTVSAQDDSAGGGE